MNQADQTRSEAEVFLEALEFDDPGERAAFVRHACAGDATLLSQVEGLLERQPQLGDFLEEGAVPGDPTGGAAPTEADLPGTVVGRYKLLEKIGEGGFGVVYLAEQQDPVRRQVALKIIGASF